MEASSLFFSFKFLWRHSYLQMHFIHKGPASLLMHDNDIEEIKIILKVFHQGGIQHKYMTRFL